MLRTFFQLALDTALCPQNMIDQPWLTENSRKTRREYASCLNPEMLMFCVTSGLYLHILQVTSAKKHSTKKRSTMPQTPEKNHIRPQLPLCK